MMLRSDLEVSARLVRVGGSQHPSTPIHHTKSPPIFLYVLRRVTFEEYLDYKLRW